MVKHAEAHACAAIRQGDEWYCQRCDLRWEKGEDMPDPAVCIASKVAITQAIDSGLYIKTSEEGAYVRAGGCKARQHSDQMVCKQCDLAWDMNDPHPPECAKPEAADCPSCPECNTMMDITPYGWHCPDCLRPHISGFNQEPARIHRPLPGFPTAIPLYFNKEEVEEMLEMLYSYPALGVVEGLMKKFTHAKKILDGEGIT